MFLSNTLQWRGWALEQRAVKPLSTDSFQPKIPPSVKLSPPVLSCNYTTIHNPHSQRHTACNTQQCSGLTRAVCYTMLMEQCATQLIKQCATQCAAQCWWSNVLHNVLHNWKTVCYTMLMEQCATQWLKRAAFDSPLTVSTYLLCCTLFCIGLTLLELPFICFLYHRCLQLTCSHWVGTIIRVMCMICALQCTTGWKELPCLPLLASLAPPVKHHDTPPSTSSHQPQNHHHHHEYHHHITIIIIIDIIGFKQIVFSISTKTSW